MFARQRSQRRSGAPILLGFVLLVFSASVCVAAETRIALVVGNGAYREAPLSNPPNDARLIADTLKRLDFTMIGAKPLIDADQKTMKQAIRTFGEQLERAGSDGIGLFFYAGHAVQANGKNYLIPVGADIRGEADLEDDTVSADSVLRQMTYAGERVNLVVLDACRNNPYRGRFRSPTRGLAEMSAPHGSLVAYSTAPGDVAEDGTGKNSPYSAALAEAMGITDMPIELAFKRVGRTVRETTGNRQVPWYSSSLIGDFFFAQTALVPVSITLRALNIQIEALNEESSLTDDQTTALIWLMSKRDELNECEIIRLRSLPISEKCKTIYAGVLNSSWP